MGFIWGTKTKLTGGEGKGNLVYGLRLALWCRSDRCFFLLSRYRNIWFSSPLQSHSKSPLVRFHSTFYCLAVVVVVPLQGRVSFPRILSPTCIQPASTTTTTTTATTATTTTTIITHTHPSKRQNQRCQHHYPIPGQTKPQVPRLNVRSVASARG